MAWSQWLQDCVSDLLASLARIAEAVEAIATAAEKEADRGRE